MEIAIFIALLSIILVLLLIYTKPPKIPDVMAVMSKLQPQEEVTTVLPIPFQAATCTHAWDVITEHKLEMDHEKKCVIILQCRRCGMIDKTIQGTNPIPRPAPQPCLHDWQIALSHGIEVPHEKKYVCIMTCRKCGVVDKTQETTSKPPPEPKKEWTKADCRHQWEVEKRVVLDSAYEQMLKSINVGPKKKADPDKNIELDLDKAPPWMFKKSYISIRICKTCGEIDKTIASNFEYEEEESVVD